MLCTFYLNKSVSFKKILIQKIFTKYVYTKFLILATFKISKSKIILILDNFFLEFSYKLKKKFKRMKFLSKIKMGSYFKGNFFLYRHSKLTSIFFLSTRFNTYLKKKIYFSLNNFKCLLKSLNLVFVYKNTRGGFLGFSNNILGFFSKKYFLKLQFFIKKNFNLLIYKKYFILLNVLTCLPYKYTNHATFFIYNAGFIRNFQKIKKKKSLRRFFFKRFKFFFLAPFYILKKKILYLKKNLKKIFTYKSSFFFHFIFKFFLSLLLMNKKKLLLNK